MTEQIINILKNIPVEEIKKPETIEDNVKEEIFDDKPIKPKDLIKQIKYYETVVKTILFIPWVKKICNNFENIKIIKLDNISDIDKLSTVVLKIPVRRGYHLLSYNDMRNIHIVDLPILSIDFYPNKMFHAVLELNENFAIKIYYDNQNHGDYVVCYRSKEGYLIPIDFPHKYLLKEKEIKFKTISKKLCNKIEEKIVEKLNIEILLNNYEMSKKYIDKLYLNKDVLIWFGNILNKTIDKKHFLKIDKTIKLLMNYE